MRKYYNLSSSQFIDYFGFNKYIKGKGSHGKRNTRLKMDILGEKPEMSDFARPFAEYGRNNEINALKSYADFRGKKGKDFYFILDNQKSFELHDFAQTERGIVSLSSTPDGITDCFKVVVECKAGKLGKDIYTLDEIKSKYTTQIFGQQYVLDRLGYAPEKTHFINWCPHKFQVYEIERNLEYEEYLEQRLMEYAFALLSEQEFTEKTEEFVVDDKLFNLIHEVDNGKE
jgi:hypothetical protein